MEEPTNNNSVNSIVWQAAEFETHIRDWRWYAVFSLLWVVLIGYSIYSRQWMLLASVVVVGSLLLFSNRIRPRQMTYRIDSAGLSINNKLYLFEQLKNYWFHVKDGKVYLNLVSTSKFMPTITIRIDQFNQESIQTVLAKFLPMSEHTDEDWIDKINRFLKV
ncbi:MAG: hypothetical protein VE97_C0008G0002 [candidate division Kazan bacterium GW2011_GWB1_45_10]|uniref:DUF5673 domain-containing protein n=1 Tax=candidate division Kazan bacterium GW2011_GWB1_45_10 TaxID=1620411 RepID=A0A0G1N1S4_UNCK3|nr:MAG: hypothetical protein VE97_C0008G0002 [candidate division Kazan bacterium GW2011_GWB1_45_10]